MIKDYTKLTKSALIQEEQDFRIDCRNSKERNLLI